jgi:hypothetical protein
MKFWDSSALLALLLEERRSAAVLAILHNDPDAAVWCLTEVEIESGLAGRCREGLDPEDERAAMARLCDLRERWHEVVALEQVRRRAVRLLRVHPLNAADSLQLGAALVLCSEQPDALPFVCLDEKLAAAAAREGFLVLPDGGLSRIV